MYVATTLVALATNFFIPYICHAFQMCTLYKMHTMLKHMKAMKLSYTFKVFFFLSIMLTIPSLLRNQQFVKNIKQR
jgi:hypothetical protein